MILLYFPPRLIESLENVAIKYVVVLDTYVDHWSVITQIIWQMLKASSGQAWFLT